MNGFLKPDHAHLSTYTHMTPKERALLVAEKAHANQQYDIYPYIYHIRQVVSIAENLGYDEAIVVACVLHDVLEDTDLSYNDMSKESKISCSITCSFSPSHRHKILR